MRGDFPEQRKTNNNILIPKEARTPILKELHSTHLGSKLMKKIFCRRFFWNEDVEKTYRECDGCQREASNKVKKTCEVIPPDLT